MRVVIDEVCCPLVLPFFSCARPVGEMATKASRGLKFCPETNDLLYPRENKVRTYPERRPSCTRNSSRQASASSRGRLE